MKNPYPLTEDNKRYQTWNYYTKTHYGTRLYKVPIDAGFTCPNRDGRVSFGGCVFCGGGSNSFPEISGRDLYAQYQERRKVFTSKWPEGKPLAYFQSYTNTYAPLEYLKKIYDPFINDPEIVGLVIATRCDCLPDDIVNYLAQLTEQKEIWLELGLQSIHDTSLKEMNRGHDYESFVSCLERIKDKGFKISVHIINGWPSETKEMMIETAKAVGRMPVDAVKIHMLHVLKDTVLADRYIREPFHLLSKEEYTEICAEQLTYLRPDMVIERITGDGLPDQLIEPMWTVKKISVINDIDKIMVRNDWWQVKYYEEN
ncbi:MAG: TIGR01212 family radical SAM protein [Erysipelotrichaceae bacterium]|nr:TIGR01212 family radical SAM protein [Erysipelotrichaceae bacterium]